MTGMINTRNRIRFWYALPLVLIVTGCVSSTLEPGQFRPVGAQNSRTTQLNAIASDSKVKTGDQNPQVLTPTPAANAESSDPNAIDEAAQQRAIAEMRAKGQQSSGVKTIIGALPEPATSQLTDAEREKKAAELAAKVETVNETITDSEVESKQQSIRRLQLKAQSHYDNAIESIEN